jgi:hypothetical protein
MDITKGNRAWPNQMIYVSDMIKPDISSPQRAFLQISEANLILHEEILQNLNNIGEWDLTWGK